MVVGTVAVIGGYGQLGSDVVEVLDGIPFRSYEVDVTDPKTFKHLKEVNPKVIVNCAAYVKVDDAEDEPSKAFEVNTVGALNVSKFAREIGAIHIYISTDYVFDGAKQEPYTEKDQPNPLNVYGLSKYAGEIAVRNYSSKYYIVRVASLYGKKGSLCKGGNFVTFVLEKARRGETIHVVDDMIMSPTYTKDVANGIKWLLENNAPCGLYHMVNEGYCSWYEFTKEIFNILGISTKLEPIKTKDLHRKARRPQFSALQNARLKTLGYTTRHWKDALRAYLQEVGECHSNL